MKKILILAFVLSGFFALGASESDYMNDPYYWEPPTGMVRGVGNMITSPLEIFRDMSYWTQVAFDDHPQLLGLDGFVFGTVLGTCWTGIRFSVGFLDLPGGFAGNIVHCDRFPTWVWEDLWSPLELGE